MSLAADLPAQDKVDVVPVTVAFQGRPVESRYGPDLLADYSSRVVHGRGRRESCTLLEISLKQRHHRLRQRQTAARYEHEDALPALDETVHLG